MLTIIYLTFALATASAVIPGLKEIYRDEKCAGNFDKRPTLFRVFVAFAIGSVLVSFFLWPLVWVAVAVYWLKQR